MRRHLTLLLSLIFLCSLLTSPAQAAIKQGSKCTTEGQVKNSQGKKFVCTKLGKKLVWRKGISQDAKVPSSKPDAAPATTTELTPATTPEPAPATTTEPAPVNFEYSAPSIPTDQLENCKIKEVSNVRGMTGAGFPEWNSLTAKVGKVKWALIPIDFPDLPGEATFRSRVDDQMKLLSEWFETVSEGKFKVEWVVADNWKTLPSASSEYTIAQSANLNKAPNGPKLFRDAMNAADPSFDFAGVQTVNFILPLNQKVIDETSQGFPWDDVVKEFQTKEGKISSFSIPGDFMSVPGKTYWSYWAHEFGHAIGLPHIGTSRGDAIPFHALDILGSQDGPDRELSGWIRFIAGWLPEERIYCKDSKNLSEVEMTLVPLSGSETGVKLAVIPITDRKALLIESRRVTKFSCTTATKRDGVLVYSYDATLGHNENFLVPYSATSRAPEKDSCSSLNSRSGPPVPDLLLKSGEKVTIDGVTIEVLKHGNFDKIRVTKSK